MPSPIIPRLRGNPVPGTIGTYKPGPTTTGPRTGMTLLSGNQTITTAGTVLDGYTITGRVIVQAANVVIRNCHIRGSSSTPAAETPMVAATSASCTNLLIENCLITPDFPHYGWESGVSGHDFTLRRCNIHGFNDGVNVFNTNAPTANSNVVIEGNWIHDLAYWSASTSGVVHTSDTVTHNDCIQHQGGRGTVIQGNYLDARYAREFGHWWRVDSGAAEPFTFQTTGARSDGGPFQPVPDSGTGTEATGRYNLTHLSAIMFNDNVGETTNFVVTDNWIRGGYIPLNGGGLSWSVGTGTIHRNQFSREPGAQSTGGDNVYTISFDATWVGNLDYAPGGANKNVFESNGAEVNVRMNG